MGPLKGKMTMMRAHRKKEKEQYLTKVIHQKNMISTETMYPLNEAPEMIMKSVVTLVGTEENALNLPFKGHHRLNVTARINRKVTRNIKAVTENILHWSIGIPRKIIEADVQIRIIFLLVTDENHLNPIILIQRIRAVGNILN